MIALLALTGPPGAGKTTLARRIAERYDTATVFHLPRVARQLRQVNEHVPHLLVDPDPLSRYGDAVVAYCLRHTFLEGYPPAGEVIVFAGLPASPAQVGYLHALATLRKVPLTVVELTAPPVVLRARGGARRPGEFARRLGSWRERAGQIRNAAVVRHRPYHLVDATADLDHHTERTWATCVTSTVRPALRLDDSRSFRRRLADGRLPGPGGHVGGGRLSRSLAVQLTHRAVDHPRQVR